MDHSATPGGAPKDTAALDSARRTRGPNTLGPRVSVFYILHTVIKDAKRKGTRIEHKIIQRLTKEGYTCTRAGGSLGMWDIIAVRKDCVKLIQAKANRWPGTVELEALTAFEAPAVVSKEIWRWNDFARSAQVRYL